MQQKIAAHGLEMKLISVEYTFDNSKIIFFFTADGRVDFRELVRDLASVFHTRVELRQVGVRDEAKLLGGIGICGREFCCSKFLNAFQPVSIKMAKEQNLSLNPVKISGTCGRLMCCLKYEQNAYEYLHKISPRVGASVKPLRASEPSSRSTFEGRRQGVAGKGRGDDGRDLQPSGNPSAPRPPGHKSAEKEEKELPDDSE